MIQRKRSALMPQISFASTIGSLLLRLETIANKLHPNNRTLQPAKTNSSPSSGAGVFAQYALYIWDSQQESYPNLSGKQTYLYLHLTTSQSCSTHHYLLSSQPRFKHISYRQTTDKGVTPISIRSSPRWLPAINHYKFTILLGSIISRPNLLVFGERRLRIPCASVVYCS